jgi:hypothetical protein
LRHNNHDWEQGMSGSNGGGGGTWDDPPPCAALVIDTQLSSPKPAVIAGVQVDEIMDVAVQDMGGASAVVVLRQGQVAGGLASPQVTRLRQCMAGGQQYQAKVTDVQGGQVRVRVYAV